jgi:hypothetical protein
VSASEDWGAWKDGFGPDPIIWTKVPAGRSVSTGDGRFEIDRGWDPRERHSVWRLFDGGVKVAQGVGLRQIVLEANRRRREGQEGGGAGPKTDPVDGTPAKASERLEGYQ